MKIRLLMVIFLVSLAQASFAVTISNLYRAEITLPLVDSEKKLINKAFKQAIEEVLIKVSGNLDGVADVLPGAQKVAASWVVQHSITDDENLIELDGAFYPAKKVVVDFYAQSINDYLFSKKMAVWGANRPSLLLWIVEQGDFLRQVSGAQSPSDLLNLVAKDAISKGLPIYAPLQDALDKQAVTVADLWGLFEEPVIEASRRYQTDVTGVLKVNKILDEYEANLMVLLPNEEPIMLFVQGLDQEDIAEQVNAALAKLFSARYAAVRGQGGAKITLRIDDVTDFQRLDQIQAYLAKIAVVRDVYLNSIDADQVHFSLVLDGGLKKLTNAIALDSVIERIELDVMDPEVNLVQAYRYSGVND